MTVDIISADVSQGQAFLKAVTDMSQRRPVKTSRAIYNDRGLKLLEGGVVVDGSLYDRLATHRLAGPLDECLESEPAVSARSLGAAVEQLIDSSAFFAQMAPAGRVRRMLHEAVEAVPLPRPVAFQLTLLEDSHPELFGNCVRTALLSAHLVAAGGAMSQDITVAAAAGLLHDVGMLHIDPELLVQQRRLVGDERRPLYVHPLTGSMLVDRFHVYPREISRAIVEHHERLDGSGYPRGLAGKAISPLGRVLSLAAVVATMFDGRRRFPEQRVSLLLRLHPLRYDAQLVTSVQRLLQRLPPPAQASAVLVDEALHRVQMHCDLLVEWRERVAPPLAETQGPGAAVIQSIGEQIESLQFMLNHAGVNREQLARLTDEDKGDASVQVELWAIEQELQWHLRATANQLRRRWAAELGASPVPQPLADWLGQVQGMDQGQ